MSHRQPRNWGLTGHWPQALYTKTINQNVKSWPAVCNIETRCAPAWLQWGFLFCQGRWHFWPFIGRGLSPKEGLFVCPRSVVLNRGWFCPTGKESSATSGDIFGGHNLGVPHWLLEGGSRNGTQLPPEHRTALHNRELPVWSATCAKVEILCSGHVCLLSPCEKMLIICAPWGREPCPAPTLSPDNCSLTPVTISSTGLLLENYLWNVVEGNSSLGVLLLQAVSTTSNLLEHASLCPCVFVCFLME